MAIYIKLLIMVMYVKFLSKNPHKRRSISGPSIALWERRQRPEAREWKAISEPLRDGSTWGLCRFLGWAFK